MKSLCLVLFVALSLSACSGFSESARRQHAYEKYVRKSAVTRTRQQAQFSRSRAPQMPVTEAAPVTQAAPAAEIAAQENPQSVPREPADH